MQKKYQFLIYLVNNPLHNTASSKAVQDCAAILSAHNYENLNIHVKKEAGSMIFTVIGLFRRLFGVIMKVKRGSLIFVQYPQHFANNQVSFLIKALKKVKGCKAICITHDVESIRPNNTIAIEKEIGWFNDYDVVITHNDIMKKWLLDHGLKAPAISLELFDYLLPVTQPTKIDGEHADVVFAGNLIKSVFVTKLHELSNVKFNLYGPKPTADLTKPNVDWKGSFAPDEIVFKLSGKFGLIWDGDDLDKCSGVLGDYMRYNNPHKLSLYIAAGLPVIVPHNSAIAVFVTKHNIGITVDDLRNLRVSMDNISDDRYETFKRNITQIRSQISKGDFFAEAIRKAEKILN